MSRFERFDIGRALARALNIKGINNMPNELDTSSAKVTVGLEPGMLGGGQVQLVGQSSLAGFTGATWLAIGPETFSPGFAGGINSPFATIRSNSDLECVILGLRLEFGFVEPIGAGDIGCLIEVREFRQAAGNTASTVRLSSFRGGLMVDTYQDRYIWSYPMWQHPRLESDGGDPPLITPVAHAPMAASPIYVPPGSLWGLEVQFWEPTMSALRAFPVGMTLDVQGFVVTAPKGMRPPGM